MNNNWNSASRERKTVSKKNCDTDAKLLTLASDTNAGVAAAAAVVVVEEEEEEEEEEVVVAGRRLAMAAAVPGK